MFRKKVCPILVLLSLLLSAVGCRVSNKADQDLDPPLDYETLQITAIDLSENFSRFSTMNDEMLILIYQNRVPLEAPIVDTLLIFDEKQREHQLKVPQQSNLLVVFVEVDSENHKLQIEPLIRVHQKELADALASRDYILIEKLIGDEDYLGHLVIHFEKKRGRIEVSGVHKLDQYNYQVAW